MNTPPAVWGIHPLRGVDFAAAGNVLILERPGVGDLRRYGVDRARLKAALVASYPSIAPGTIAQWTGTLLRFAVLAKDDDFVVHPNPSRRTLSLGRLVGEYFWQDADPVDRHVRRVRWIHGGIQRDALSATAQKAVSGRAAFFSAERAADELRGLVAHARVLDAHGTNPD